MSQTSLSKKSLSGRLQKITLLLSEKVQLLNYRKKNSKIDCKDIVKIFKFEKTCSAKSMPVLKLTKSKIDKGNFTNSVKLSIFD